jgi:hypothetical protein
MKSSGSTSTKMDDLTFSNVGGSGKRVRWLDENNDMLPTDTRGDQVGDVLQIDKNGDGLYDGPLDIDIKWADNDGDGRADLEAFVTQPPEWGPDKWSVAEAHWMISSTSRRMACWVGLMDKV